MAFILGVTGHSSASSTVSNIKKPSCLIAHKELSGRPIARSQSNKAAASIPEQTFSCRAVQLTDGPVPRRQAFSLAAFSALVLLGKPDGVHAAAGGVTEAYTNLEDIGVPESKYTTTPSGLKYYEIKVGKGFVPEVGETVVVHYKGALPSGKTFLSTYEDGKPAQYRFGVGEVIKGIEEAVSTMKTGGKRRIILPPELAYGNRTVPSSPGKPSVPAGSTVTFDIELLYIPGRFEEYEDEE